jgi:hypothetical protein
MRAGLVLSRTVQNERTMTIMTVVQRLLPLLLTCAAEFAAAGDTWTISRGSANDSGSLTRTGPPLADAPAIALLGERLQWCEPLDAAATFFSTPAAAGASASDVALIQPAEDLVARLINAWPSGADLVADVDSLGPGGESAWLRVGSRHGVRVGDRFWRRLNGQPAQRLDVRVVANDVSYCRVIVLAAGAKLAEGAIAVAWPTPVDRREGRSSSAVSFVDPAGGDPFVWIPVPPKADWPPEPRIDFFHGGKYVGFGIVEKRDARFWHARALAKACVRPLAVGDDAVVRTSATLARGEISARVFDHNAEGALITASEADNLVVGQRGTVVSDGQVRGLVSVTRVQNGYAIVVPVQPAGNDATVPAVQPKNFDEIRFASLSRFPRCVAKIDRIDAPDLFRAAAIGPPPAPDMPLAIVSEGKVIGVAVRLPLGTTELYGMVLPRSQTAPLTVGAELIMEDLLPPPGL